MTSTFQYGNVSIFYRIEGEGKPLMLLHGFGEDSAVWDEMVPGLLPGHQLLIPDLPGSGQSEPTPDMSIEGMAAAISAIADVVFPSPYTMIGHSMGGYVALAYMEKHKERLAGLGLFHSSSFPDSEEKKNIRRKAISFGREHGAFAFLETSIPGLFSPLSRDEMPDRIQRQVAAQHNFSTDSFVAYYEAMTARPDRSDILRQAEIPVLFLMGKYDMAVPLKDSLQQCHLPGKSYIHILRKSGHMGMIEEAGTATGYIREYLVDI